MTYEKPITARRIVKIFALSMVAAIAGVLLTQSFGAILRTSPLWLGPALVIGALTILIGGLLLLPAFVRTKRATKHGPSA